MVVEPIVEEYWLDQSVWTGWRWSENIGLLLRGFWRMSQKCYRRMSKVAAPLDLPVGNEKHFLLLSNSGKKKGGGEIKNERKREKEKERQQMGERIALLHTPVSCLKVASWPKWEILSVVINEQLNKCLANHYIYIYICMYVKPTWAVLLSVLARTLL